jgi:ATP-dependent helicase HepA
MSKFITGQRWISESEPELGLGAVDHADSNRVQIGFKAAGVTRTYSADHAPLKRVRFRVGDKIKTQVGNEFVVKEVLEQHGLLTYIGENQRLAESDLNDNLSLRGPQERLFAGRFDASQLAQIFGARFPRRSHRSNPPPAFHRARGLQPLRPARHALGRGRPRQNH